MLRYLSAQQVRYLQIRSITHSISRAPGAMCSATTGTVNTLLGEASRPTRLLEHVLTLLAKPLIINNRKCGLFGKENIMPIFLKFQLQKTF